MTRVVREKLLREGRFHGQLKFRNAKLLPFPGMSDFLLCHGTLRTQEGQAVSLYVVLLSFSPFLWASQKTRIPSDQVYRSCRRRLRVRTLAVPVLLWYQGKATSPSSLVRHQREGTLLPRAGLAGRMFFPTCGTQNHYPRYPRIIQCADKLVMLLLHLSNAFIWPFIIFPAPLGSSLWARQY